MAFKSIKQIEQDRFKNLLRLSEDGESAQGVLLYNSYDDVLIADAHYINSRDYKGYVHCCGDGCPACAKGIRVQQKLFIPILILADLNKKYDEDKVIFWDRNRSFNHQLEHEVFKRYPCPSDVVFKITRFGEYQNINTKYQLQAKYNYAENIDAVLKSMGVSFPEYYENIIKTVDISDLSDMINDFKSASASQTYVPTQDYSYKATPRKKFADPEDMDCDALPGSEVEADSDLESPVFCASDALPSFNSSNEPESASAFECIEDAVEDEDDCEPTF